MQIQPPLHFGATFKKKQVYATVKRLPHDFAVPNPWTANENLYGKAHQDFLVKNHATDEVYPAKMAPFKEKYDYCYGDETDTPP